jgi:hypothetical protein
MRCCVKCLHVYVLRYDPASESRSTSGAGVCAGCAMTNSAVVDVDYRVCLCRKKMPRTRPTTCASTFHASSLREPVLPPHWDRVNLGESWDVAREALSVLKIATDRVVLQIQRRQLWQSSQLSHIIERFNIILTKLRGTQTSQQRS